MDWLNLKESDIRIRTLLTAVVATAAVTLTPGIAYAQGNDSGNAKTHVVVEGDYLDKIAHDNDTTWKRLYDKNTNIENPDLILPGQEVKIPAPEEDVPSRAAVEAAPAPTPTPVVEATAPAPTPAPAPAPAPVSGKDAILAAAGIPASDYGYVDYIVSHEGGWDGAQRYNALGSGAYGICQALPASKMASAGGDYMTNPVTQLKWCDSYAKSRYGSWAGAYSAWISQQWW